MVDTDLEILSDDALVDLGAQLEIDLAEAEARLLVQAGRLADERKGLAKPGVKLAINAAVGIAGVSLAPITFGWSLALTVISGAVTVSDAFDYTGEMSRFRADARELHALRQLVEEIVAELDDIHHLLEKRLGHSQRQGNGA